MLNIFIFAVLELCFALYNFRQPVVLQYHVFCIIGVLKISHEIDWLLRRNLKSTVLTTSTMSAFSLFSLSFSPPSLSMLSGCWVKKAVYSGRPFTDPFCYTSVT